jgi:hypothetical protein
VNALMQNVVHLCVRACLQDGLSSKPGLALRAAITQPAPSAVQCWRLLVTRPNGTLSGIAGALTLPPSLPCSPAGELIGTSMAIRA